MKKFSVGMPENGKAKLEERKALLSYGEFKIEIGLTGLESIISALKIGFMESRESLSAHHVKDFFVSLEALQQEMRKMQNYALHNGQVRILPGVPFL